MTNIEIGNTDYFDIKEVAYELYKQDWVDTHAIREERLDALRNYYAYVEEESREGEVGIDSFEEWIYDNGYSGRIYACYEEFCECEYLDSDYITELLSDKKLVELYLKDLEEEEE